MGEIHGEYLFFKTHKPWAPLPARFNILRPMAQGPTSIHKNIHIYIPFLLHIYKLECTVGMQQNAHSSISCLGVEMLTEAISVAVLKKLLVHERNTIAQSV
jgi:hypothetical protein